MPIPLPHLPEVGTYRLWMANLSSNVRMYHPPKAFVSRSAVWFLVLMSKVWISTDSTRSHRKEPSISTCFIRSWKTGLFVICLAAWLSQNKGVEPCWLTSSSYNNHLNYKFSLIVKAITRYSASAEDRGTTDCFLDFLETKAPPKVSRYAVRDFWRKDSQANQSHNNRLG